ncbi:MAG: hypothetical protein QOG04_93 [Actinomycetota bacterium]|nr:hypothetical protein [Actinomycetota bacterium]
MAIRFCSACQTDVEDVGGFCLLGHSLREVAPVDSLQALRDEVNQAFEEARVKVAHGLVGAPPPPPPPAVSAARVEVGESSDSDPIVDFAPAPRMDWGPERQGLLKRLH